MPNSHETRPLVLGLTGGMAAGKSLVGKMLQAFGVPVWDADAAAKSLYRSDAILREAVLNQWGEDYALTDADGRAYDLDRAKLAALIFTDDEAKLWLESKVHPAVSRVFDVWCTSHGVGASYIVREAAILFESGTHEGCDWTATVEAPEALRIQRALHRPGSEARTKEDVLRRMSLQWSREERARHADFVIENDGRPLLAQVLALHQRMMQKVKA
ncbi:MAG: dephospho-CoA kinase [Bacteroidetes bacterium]|nr:dephospho-CoA kinase [Bacteroidota bacterium]MDA0903033.1 dephospho-CoA kinase [Bacteroidota bacterium]MDA1241757.1 dephospho-CoA kinase [Bacteroidota bacterium]